MDASQYDKARDIEELVAFRMARQKILLGEDPPHLATVIGEAALRQCVGGPAVMRAQLDRLITVAGDEQTTVRILPFSAGAQPGPGGCFTIFELRAPGRLTVVAVEDLTRISFRELDQEAAVFLSAFHRLSTGSLDETCSLALMKRIRSET